MARPPAAGQGELVELARTDWKNEAAFQRHIVRTAKANGWLVFHVPRMRGREGAWLTNTLLPGWPDLVLIRPPTIMFIEVKVTARPSKEQRHLIGLLKTVRRVVAAFAYPADWPALAAALTADTPPLTE